MTFHIKLIVTGDMEKLALSASLSKIFPAYRQGQSVEWLPARKVDGATSHRLRKDATPSRPMRSLALAMLAEALVGRNKTPADLVIVIDDLELGNLDQPELVAAHFRQAVELELQSYPFDSEHGRQKAIRTIRSKCSFHVLRPMIESYLFGDPLALCATGLPAAVEPQLRHPTDVEDFESADSAWQAICSAENRRLQKINPWWNHEKHPKHYLAHLLKREKIGDSYEETIQGKNALLALNWLTVPKIPEDISCMRALFQDLADWFEIPTPLKDGPTSNYFYPTKACKQDLLILRNL